MRIMTKDFSGQRWIEASVHQVAERTTRLLPSRLADGAQDRRRQVHRALRAASLARRDGAWGKELVLCLPASDSTGSSDAFKSNALASVSPNSDTASGCAGMHFQ